MKMQIFIIKNGFIVFLGILQKNLYTFACAQNDFTSTFFTLIESPQKKALNALTASSGDESR